MDSRKPILFITDKSHLNAPINGGVQICTAEYLDLLISAGFNPVVFPVTHTKKVWPRLKIKFGIDSYDRYDFKDMLPAVIDQIDMLGIQYLAINQVALAGFLPLIRNKNAQRVSVIVLSHGNETGDFLHEIVREKKRGIESVIAAYRLGLMLTMESNYYSHSADLVVSISETEMNVNNWLGAKKSLFMPRVFNSSPLEWKPELGRVGFVGTLDHKPNYHGLVDVLNALQSIPNHGVSVRLVGGPERVGCALQQQYDMVEYLGKMSDADLRHEASSWCFFLNPIFWYARGASTKLAQAVNWGIPVISTFPGNRGYSWSRGNILTVNSALEMAEKLVEISPDLDKLNELKAQLTLVACNGPSLSELGRELANEIALLQS